MKKLFFKEYFSNLIRKHYLCRSKKNIALLKAIHQPNINLKEIAK